MILENSTSMTIPADVCRNAFGLEITQRKKRVDAYIHECTLTLRFSEDNFVFLYKLALTHEFAALPISP